MSSENLNYWHSIREALISGNESKNKSNKLENVLKGTMYVTSYLVSMLKSAFDLPFALLPLCTRLDAISSFKINGTELLNNPEFLNPDTHLPFTTKPFEGDDKYNSIFGTIYSSTLDAKEVLLKALDDAVYVTEDDILKFLNQPLEFEITFKPECKELSGVFMMCPVIECEIPEQLTGLGEIFFGLTLTLEKVILPASITHINSTAFVYTAQLSGKFPRIEYKGTPEQWFTKMLTYDPNTIVKYSYGGDDIEDVAVHCSAEQDIPFARFIDESNPFYIEGPVGAQIVPTNETYTAAWDNGNILYSFDKNLPISEWNHTLSETPITLNSNKIYFRTEVLINLSSKPIFTCIDDTQRLFSIGGQLATVNNPYIIISTSYHDCFSISSDGYGLYLTSAELLELYGSFNMESLFENNTTLIQAPALIKGDVIDLTTAMFKECTSLQESPDILGNTMLEYEDMFYNCTSLNTIKVHVTSWSPIEKYSFAVNVSPTGTFYNYGGADIPIDESGTGIPIGWTVAGLPEAKSLEFIQSNIDIQKGDSFNINDIITSIPKMSNIDNFTITSSNPNIINVNNKILSAQDTGSATISIKYKKGTIIAELTSHSVYKYLKVDFSDLLVGDEIVMALRLFDNTEPIGDRMIVLRTLSADTIYADLKCIPVFESRDVIKNAEVLKNGYSTFIVKDSELNPYLTFEDTKYNLQPYGNILSLNIMSILFGTGGYLAPTKVYLGVQGFESSDNKLLYAQSLDLSKTSYLVCDPEGPADNVFNWEEPDYESYTDQSICIYKLIKS